MTGGRWWPGRGLRGAVALTSLLGAGCFGPAERGPCGPPAKPGEIGSICGFRSPEDLEHVRRTGLIIVSNLTLTGAEGGGYLAAFEPGLDAIAFRLWPREGEPAGPADPTLGDPACTAPPDPDAFSPHGLTSRNE